MLWVKLKGWRSCRASTASSLGVSVLRQKLKRALEKTSADAQFVTQIASDQCSCEVFKIKIKIRF